MTRTSVARKQLKQRTDWAAPFGFQSEHVHNDASFLPFYLVNTRFKRQSDPNHQASKQASTITTNNNTTASSTMAPPGAPTWYLVAGTLAHLTIFAAGVLGLVYFLWSKYREAGGLPQWLHDFFAAFGRLGVAIGGGAVSAWGALRATITKQQQQQQHELGVVKESN
ncbi:hypothetical protein PG993_008549 [Apiospora rasikravindrae]|uniref:Uncharacterized protein n=1 Tax=Apiospora rasikravindrae TaxID=990691 RepID=A0ABR1T0P4_9PEZI